MTKTNVSEFRSADNYNEQYIRPIMNQIYQIMGWRVLERVDDERQYRGADVILQVPVGRGISYVLTMDEKLDSQRLLNADYFKEESEDKAFTFCQELHMLNQAGQWQNGWFHPSTRQKALNQCYVYIWVRGEKDTPRFDDKSGLFTRLSEIEICVVKHDDLVEFLEKDPKFHYNAEFLNDFIAKIKAHVANAPNKKHPLNLPEWRFDGAHPCYSGQLDEKPINLIVTKKRLRDISLCSFAFRLKGAGGKEEIVTYRRTKWAKHKNDIKEFRPITEFVA